MKSIKICQHDNLVKDDNGKVVYIDSYGEATHFSSPISFLLWWDNTGGPELSRDEKAFLLDNSSKQKDKIMKTKTIKAYGTNPENGKIYDRG